MTESEEFVVDANVVDWIAGKTGLSRKFLINLPNGPSARIVRMGAGEVVPRHKHPCAEIMYVLDGEVEMGGKVYGPGTCYYKPPHWFYGPLTTRTGVSMLLFFDGPYGFQE